MIYKKWKVDSTLTREIFFIFWQSFVNKIFIYHNAYYNAYHNAYHAYHNAYHNAYCCIYHCDSIDLCMFCKLYYKWYIYNSSI